MLTTSREVQEERRARFERTNQLLMKNGLNPLHLGEEEVVRQEDQEQLQVAEALGLDVLEWKAICGTEGMVHGLHVDKLTFRALTKKPEVAKLRQYAKYRLAVRSRKPRVPKA